MRPKRTFALLLLLLPTGPIASAQKSAPDVESPRGQLSRFSGTWEKQFTVYKSEWSPGEQTKSGTHTCLWILDGRYLQETGQDSDGAKYMAVYSYDEAAEVYRASVFQSSGNSWHSSGHWDDASKSFTWTHSVADGVQMVGTYKFVKPNQFTFSYVAKNAANHELFRLEGSGSRKESK
jgi:hypothetical protein